jgi:hypothetical protein
MNIFNLIIGVFLLARLIGKFLEGYGSNASPMPKNMAKMDVCSINKIIVWVNRGAINN